jgi:hypothetical protein
MPAGGVDDSRTGARSTAWSFDSRDRIVMKLTRDADWPEIRELVTQSYRILAPKKLTTLLGWRPAAVTDLWRAAYMV